MIDCNEWRTEKRQEYANMGEGKTTRIMMATVPHVTSGLGLRKFQADGFLLTRVYIKKFLKFQFMWKVSHGAKRSIIVHSKLERMRNTAVNCTPALPFGHAKQCTVTILEETVQESNPTIS